MKYVWQIKQYWGAKRKRPTDYFTSGEFDSLEKALEFKQMDRELRLKHKDDEDNEGLKLLEIIDDSDTFVRYRHLSHDTVFELHRISDNHRYRYQLDDGTWVKEK